MKEKNNLLPSPKKTPALKFRAFAMRKATRAFSRTHLAASIYLIVSVLIILIVQTALILIFGEKGAAIYSNPYFLWGLQVFAMYVVAFPVFLLITKDLPRALRRKSSMSLGEFVVIFFISQAAMQIGALISNIFVGFLSEKLGYEIQNETSELIMQTPIFVVILVAVIIGPIVEELIFRKIFIDRLSVYGDRLAILVSSVSFGVFHGNFSQVLYATMLGLILGYVYTKTRNVKYSCLLHIAINFMGTVPTLLLSESVARLENMDPEAIPEGTDMITYLIDSTNILGVAFLQYAFAIAGIVLFIILTVRGAYKVPNECDIRIPKRHLPRVLIFNFGTLIFLLITALQFISSVIPIS